MKLRATSQGAWFINLVLCLMLLDALGALVARADDSSKAVKIAELMQLTAARQFLRSVDGNFDQEDAARAWGRFYADNLTEGDLDAILAYYRSPAGQKDVSASRAALAQVQHYMVEKRRAGAGTAGVPGHAAGNNTVASRGGVESATAVTAAPNTATSSMAAAGTVTPSAGTGNTAMPAAAGTGNIVMPGAAGTGNTAVPAAAGTGNTVMPGAAVTDSVMRDRAATGDAARPWDSNPLAPNGRVIPSTGSPERCEVAPPAAPGVHAVPPSGRSVVCVCTDEKGALTRDPVIAESSGDSRVDSGALKMARIDSGRYVPPTLGGRPQSACFRFAIDFRRQQ